MKRNPFISLPGCVTAVIFIIVMVGVTLALGGVLFSPGALSAQGNKRVALQGFASHADIEGRCEYCHAPWQGVTAALCEKCHTSIAEERRAGTGVHGVLKSAADCRLCHVEHQGRAADQTVAAINSFPHEQTGYSLVEHQHWSDGRAFACRDCHASSGSGYEFKATLCETCHRQINTTFVTQHTAKYSADCMVCHQQLDPFDHHTFPLRAGHANLRCDQCHADPDFNQANAKCNACHADPAIHAGMFGVDCAVCHTIDDWLPAKLSKHDFPIDHGGEGVIPCATCHTQSYREYTCYNCHEHSDEAEIKAKHLEEGIVEFSDCMACHADGQTHEQ
jgi:hypothetical protein